jgi:hypothetical protein
VVWPNRTTWAALGREFSSIRSPGPTSADAMPSASTASRPLPLRMSRPSWSALETTSPRLYAECGATGVTTSASTPGLTIGPPAEKL